MWRRFIAGVLSITLIIGVVLVFEENRSLPTVSIPSTGIISVTGYARMTAAYGSTDPTTVVLTSDQATALRQSITSLPRVTLPAKDTICMEEDTVFTISVVRTQGAEVSWVATAELCPAPGLLYIKDVGSPQQAPVRYCALKSFITSIFSKSVIAGTLTGLRYCDYAS